MAGQEGSSLLFSFWLGKVFWKRQDAVGSQEDRKILIQTALKSGKERSEILLVNLKMA